MTNKSFLLGNTTVRLIDGDEATYHFSNKDMFLSNMSQFDLQARLHSNVDVTMDQYIDHICKQIVTWEPKYIKILAEVIEDLNSNEISISILNKCQLPEILVILTNGQDESDAAYCRNNNVVVLPTTKINILDNEDTRTASGNEWRETFPHELFHIFSRNNIPIRDKLYECIGYYCIPQNQETILPTHLQSLKITNPDAPITKHYIKLKCQFTDNDDKELCLAPILLASKPYDNQLYTSFFDYLLTKFAIFDDKWNVLRLITYDEVIGLYDKIGKNTTYIIHPEEILADNFVLLLNNNMNVPNPHILESMKVIINQL